MKHIALVFLLCALAACAKNGKLESAPPIQMPKCETPYVALPDNFIIDLAAGAEVALNPARQQFALFCSPADARGALAADISSGRLDSRGQWRVYILDGKFGDIAVPCGDGQFCLATPAVVKDWVE